MKKYFISITVLSTILYFILIWMIIYRLDLHHFKTAIFSERIVSIITNSVVAATVAAACALLFSIPSSYALSRWNFRLKSSIDAILELPLLISPAALGAVILLFLQTDLGKIIQDYTVEIIFTFYGIILAQFLSVLGMGIRLLKSVVDEIPTRYEQVARTLGASPFQSFLSVTLPLMKKGILSSYLIMWAKAFGEFGATLMVAGVLPFKTETIPTAIFLSLSGADIQQTIFLIFVILSVSLIILLLSRWIMKEKLHD